METCANSIGLTPAGGRRGLRQRPSRHFKCPKAVEFGDLPKTATGKIQKFKLREKEWAGRDSRIQGVEFREE